ncbi:serine/threonine protein kinase [Myxococcota bacterium]|nr:serine/threonine protein kinase [Myxococcota bacterium]MBU1381737.1 serine/threonine protein kinase [Myxococcota bacterium]MBU1496423.1 serine/threonine protein kinase [Myxococcota bacterium]
MPESNNESESEKPASDDELSPVYPVISGDEQDVSIRFTTMEDGLAVIPADLQNEVIYSEDPEFDPDEIPEISSKDHISNISDSLEDNFIEGSTSDENIAVSWGIPTLKQLDTISIIPDFSSESDVDSENSIEDIPSTSTGPKTSSEEDSIIIKPEEEDSPGIGDGVMDTHVFIKTTVRDTLPINPHIPFSTLEEANLPMIDSSRYDFKREIGKGGIGRIMLAMDRNIMRNVAIKELLTPQAIKGEDTYVPGDEAERRFLYEARLTGVLEHPGIVPVYEIGIQENGRACYIMKMVKGKTLHELIQERNFIGRLELLHNFIQFCNTIEFAHSKGVIHRDLKPANVMIGEFGETVVLDWGLAKIKGEKDHRSSDLFVDPDKIRENLGETTDGTLIGTPLYMSPEQAMGKLDDIDESSDIYALGAAIYELLTKQPVFSSRNPREVLDMVVKGQVDPPSRIEKRIPRELESIIMKAMKWKKSDRYTSVKEMSKEIKQFLAGGVVKAYSYTPIELVLRKIKKYSLPIFLIILALSGISFTWWWRGYSQLMLKNKQESKHNLDTLDKTRKILKDFLSLDNICNDSIKLFERKLGHLQGDTVDKLMTDMLTHKNRAMRILAARVCTGRELSGCMAKMLNILKSKQESDPEVTIEMFYSLVSGENPQWSIELYNVFRKFTEWSYEHLKTRRVLHLLEIPDWKQLSSSPPSIHLEFCRVRCSINGPKCNECLEGFLRREHGNTTASFELSRSYFSTGFDEKASILIMDLLKNNPNPAGVFALKGEIELRYGRQDSGESYLDKSLMWNPSSFRVNRVITLLKLANNQMLDNDHINRIIDRFRGKHGVLLHLADMLTDINKLDSAQKIINNTALSSLEPGVNWIRLKLAIARKNTGDILRYSSYISKNGLFLNKYPGLHGCAIELGSPINPLENHYISSPNQFIRHEMARGDCTSVVKFCSNQQNLNSFSYAACRMCSIRQTGGRISFDFNNKIADFFNYFAQALLSDAEFKYLDITEVEELQAFHIYEAIIYEKNRNFEKSKASYKKWLTLYNPSSVFYNFAIRGAGEKNNSETEQNSVSKNLK